MSEQILDNELTPELLEKIRQLPDQEDSPSEYRFTNPDPYAKPEPTPEEQPRRFWFDEQGHIRVKNLSAYWIPELTVTEVISGTIYTVTGSYEGTESFVRKLERITAKKFTAEMEDSE